MRKFLLTLMIKRTILPEFGWWHCMLIHKHLCASGTWLLWPLHHQAYPMHHSGWPGVHTAYCLHAAWTHHLWTACAIPTSQRLCASRVLSEHWLPPDEEAGAVAVWWLHGLWGGGRCCFYWGSVQFSWAHHSSFASMALAWITLRRKFNVVMLKWWCAWKLQLRLRDIESS